MSKSKLNIDHVARIEGHGNVHVDVVDGVVRDVQLNIVEPARLFETMIRGRDYSEVSYIASRICGICSPNHAVTTLKAIENAFGIEVSSRTQLLRQLLIYGSYLQNHATHLYVFAAPDYVGLQSAFPLAEAAPAVLKRALDIKRLGNELCTVVGGRPVHPINAVVGGFTSEPSSEELIILADKLDAIAHDCVETGDLFSDFYVPDFETDGDLLALVSDDEYAIAEGDTASLLGKWRRPVSEYKDFIVETPVAYSNAKFSSTLDGKTFMVGSLARINHSWNKLLPSARVVAAKAGLRPVCLNPFRNNMSQAIEIVDAAERCALLCRKLAESGGDSSVVDFEVRAGRGIGATEAPRGTVYHRVDLDDDGRVIGADILTPTAQNLGNLEADIKKFAPTVVDLPEKDFKLAIEKLVRAYDPCLSCAVH